jgi:hypothetical protein
MVLHLDINIVRTKWGSDYRCGSDWLPDLFQLKLQQFNALQGRRSVSFVFWRWPTSAEPHHFLGSASSSIGGAVQPIVHPCVGPPMARQHPLSSLQYGQSSCRSTAASLSSEICFQIRGLHFVQTLNSLNRHVNFLHGLGPSACGPVLAGNFLLWRSSLIWPSRFPRTEQVTTWSLYTTRLDGQGLAPGSTVIPIPLPEVAFDAS